jgi:hypothetical protein
MVIYYTRSDKHNLHFLDKMFDLSKIKCFSALKSCSSMDSTTNKTPPQDTNMT